MGKKIDLLWNDYKGTIPGIYSQLFKLLEPGDSPSKLQFSRELPFEKQAENVRRAQKEIAENWKARSVEERVEDYKALVLEVTNAIQQRHQDEDLNYAQLTTTLKSAFWSVQAMMEKNFLNDQTIGSFFVKSYFIHQAFWSAYPTQQERELCINRFILLFTDSMKKMGIESSLFYDIFSQVAKDLLAACEERPAELQEMVKFFPFFELIPLLLTLFSVAQNAAEVRPFVSEYFKTPEMIKRDLNLLGLVGHKVPLPEEVQENQLNNQQKSSDNDWQRDTILTALAPLNALLLSASFPGKSTTLKTILSPAFDKFVFSAMIADQLSLCIGAITYRALLAEEEEDSHKNGSLSDQEATTACVNGLVERFEKIGEESQSAAHPIMKKLLKDVKDQFETRCIETITPMSLDHKMALIARLDEIEVTSLKYYIDKMILDMKANVGIWKPLLYFVMFGLYGSSGVFFMKSDREHFQDFRAALKTLHDSIYRFEVEAAIKDPNYVQNHLVKTLDRLLPKIPT